MVTPENFIKQIEFFLDENEIDIDSLTCDNVDIDNNEHLLYGNDIFDFYFGATRGCFIPAYNPTFVFKFDFNELWESYCANEAEHYKQACKRGLGKCFAKTILFDNINNTPIYKCEYVEERCSKYFREVTADQIKTMNNITSKHKAPVLPTAWTQNFIDYYGIDVFETFLDFIVTYGINDLHDSNIGYKKGRPIVFDYAGFFEPSKDYCNY